MPIHRVTKCDRTQKGKPRCFLDGKTGWQDAFYLGNNVEPPPVGALIEAQTTSKTFDDGKTVWFLNRWSHAQEPQVQNGAPTPNATLGKPSTVKGWNIDAGDLSRFVSNVVGSAIAAEFITDPEQIGAWVAAAYRAGEQLRSGKVQDFNDPIPDFGTTPIGLNGPIDDAEPNF